MKRFVTFEGIEGCGKTTQIKLATLWLKERGIPFLATAEPGGTPLGRKIREILLNRGSFAIGAEAKSSSLPPRVPNTYGRPSSLRLRREGGFSATALRTQRLPTKASAGASTPPSSAR